MSMTINPSSPSQVSYSPSHTRSSFSFKDVLKVVLIAAGFFQTGITPVSADQITVHSAKLPHYCETRNDLYKHGDPFYPGIRANVLCYLDSTHLLESYAQSVQGEERLVAEFNFGQRLACPFRTIGPSIMLGGEWDKLMKKVDRENLQGLALMYNSGCLEVIYPEKGDSLDECYHKYINYRDPGTMHYKIDGCYYFVNGVLMCPDQDTFETLTLRMSQFA